MDLVILFLVFYLVAIANPKVHDHFGMIFLWVIPVIFIFYMMWDLVKYFSSSDDLFLKKNDWCRCRFGTNLYHQSGMV
jgi:hypothetical protein